MSTTQTILCEHFLMYFELYYLDDFSGKGNFHLLMKSMWKKIFNDQFEKSYFNLIKMAFQLGKFIVIS